MKRIVLDGGRMKDELHLYQALIDALGGPNWHGRNINAIIESMVYGGINEVDPPYEVVVTNAAHRTKVREAVEHLAGALVAARRDRREHWGDDAEVSIRLD